MQTPVGASGMNLMLLLSVQVVHVAPTEWAKMVRDEEASLPGYVDILLEEEAAGAGEKVREMRYGFGDRSGWSAICRVALHRTGTGHCSYRLRL